MHIPHSQIPTVRNHTGGKSPRAGVQNEGAIRPADIVELQPIAAPPEQGGALDLGALWGAFRRRWKTAVGLGIATGGIVTVAVICLVTTPYKAYSELEIKSVPEVVMFDNVDPPKRFNTYKETLMKKVMGRFVLAAALRDSKIASLPLIRSQEPHAIEWLEANLKVSSPDTEFIQISMSGENPDQITAIVNAVTNAFQQEVVSEEEGKRGKRLEQNQQVLSRLEEELKLKRTEKRRLAEPLNTGNLETLSVKQQMAAEYASKLRGELAQINLDITRTKIQLAASSGEVTQTAPSTETPRKIPPDLIETQLTADPEYQRINTRIAQLEALLVQYKERLAADKPALHRKETELADARERRDSLRKDLVPKITERLHKELAAEVTASQASLTESVALLESSKKHIEKELEAYKAEDVKTGLHAFELEELNREIEHTESIAQVIRDEIRKLEIEMNAPRRITLHREAVVPHVRETDRRTKLAAVAGFGLFVISIVCVVALEFRARRISTLDEVAGELRMRVMGTVPLLPYWAANVDSNDRSLRSEQWQSVLTESIDSARTLLLRDTTADSLKFVMVTSALSGEGKTTLACQLASSLARAGRKTLLVDGDLRHPGVHEIFELREAPGLCEILRDEVEIETAICPVATQGLFVLSAGLLDAQVLKRLSAGGAASIFTELGKRFDLIIADSSPILPVADSLLLAQYSDGVILSIRRDVSRVSKVSEACNRLSMLGVPILGAVAIGLGDDLFAYRNYYGSVDRTDLENQPTEAPSL